MTQTQRPHAELRTAWSYFGGSTTNRQSGQSADILRAMPFNAVRPGGNAVWNAAVFNMGQKTAVNVEVFMVPQVRLSRGRNQRPGHGSPSLRAGQ